MTQVLEGAIAAAVAPLAMTFGFILWGHAWKSSAYALNLFKCTFAAVIFMIISFSIRWQISVTPYDQFMIILSSILGIVIGDNTWLLALQMIGAKRVIVVDTLKPLLAAVLGNWILNEPLTWSSSIGIVISMIGILLVSLEKNAKDSQTDESISNSSEKSKYHYLIGYCLAFVNVFLDAIGSILTKQFGFTLNTWEINFLRFGFAAVSMAGIALMSFLYQKHFHPSSSSFLKLESSDDKQLDNLPIALQGKSLQSEHEKEKRSASSSPSLHHSWYIFPQYSEMTSNEWMHVIIGICFVTFLCPALSNYALFQIPLGLCLTLTSLGPVYSLPLVYFLSHETTGVQGITGAVLAVVGVGIMFL